MSSAGPLNYCYTELFFTPDLQQHHFILIFTISDVIGVRVSPTEAKVHPPKKAFQISIYGSPVQWQDLKLIMKNQENPFTFPTSLNKYKHPSGENSNRPYLFSHTFISVDPRLSYIRIFYFWRHRLSIPFSMYKVST